MTLSSYELNTTYQKTSLQYEAKITPVQPQKLENKNDENDIDSMDTNFSPIVYTNMSDLSNPQKLQKLVLEKIIGKFNEDSKSQTLIPNKNTAINKESYTNDNPNKNPYDKVSNSDSPKAFYYSSSSEYYEKTTFDFNAQATIKTPNGEYNIEINFSYTKEFYEKNETQIAIVNDKLKDSFEIEFDEDYENLKDLKSLHFIFDILEQKEDNKKDIFDEIKELLNQRHKKMDEIFDNNKNDNNLDKKQIDNFQIWQKTSKEEISLISIQKDGIGIFLANSSTESSFLSIN